MAARCILFVDAGGLSAWRWHQGRLTGEAQFPADGDGAARFATFISGRRAGLYFMLADVADEGFQLEDIPPLRGRDRIALIKRKLERHYPATPFTVALTLGRRHEGRGDERMLFTALTRPQQFEPWLRALKAEQAALAGLFSVPQLVTRLTGRSSRQERVLLITWTRGGLRQTFVEDGRMRFSRLTPLGSSMPEDAAAACAREAAKIHHYLDGQGLVAADAPLTVRVLVHPAHEAAFRNHCKDGHDLRYEYLDLPAQAAHVGLKTDLPDSNAEALFAHLLVRRTPRAQFAHADARHVFRLGQLRFALRFAGGAVLAACLLFAAAKLPGLQEIDSAVTAARMRNAEHDRRYQAVLAARPQLPLPLERLFAIADRYEEVLQRSPGPAPMYRRLAAALDDNPDIRLERLAWFIAERVDDRPDAHASAPATPGAGPYVIADLEASLPTASATDPPGQSALIDRFAARLRRDRVLEVRFLSLPFDAESAKVLTGDGDAATKAVPRFVLRVVERLERT